jgi:hypothetical protein
LREKITEFDLGDVNVPSALANVAAEELQAKADQESAEAQDEEEPPRLLGLGIGFLIYVLEDPIGRDEIIGDGADNEANGESRGCGPAPKARVLLRGLKNGKDSDLAKIIN